MFRAGTALTHRRRALLGAALTISISLLLPTPLVPATAATRGKLHQPAAATAPAPAAATAPAGGEAPSAKHNPAPAPAPAGPAAVAEDGKRARSHPAGPPAGQPRVQERHATGDGHGGGRAQGHKPGGEGAAGGGSGSGAGEAGHGAGEASQAREGGEIVSAAARSRRKGGKGGKAAKEREAREARERGEHVKEQQEREAQARADKQKATPAPAAVAASAAAAPVASEAAVAAVGPPPSAPAAPPTVVRQSAVAPSGSARHAAAAGKGHGGGLVVGGGARAALPAIAAAAPAVAGADSPANVTRHVASGTHAPAKSTAPALIQTVTKIINVVPAAMRWIIAALIALALALGVSSRLAARRARRLARQRRELLEDVGLLQAALLPALPERLGDVAASAAYQPASGPAAGGDFYDVFELEGGQLGVIVGDVSGHGRAALPHTTLVRYTLRAYLEAGLSPRSALQTAAPVLERQLGEGFATVAVAMFDPKGRKLVYASAGHPPPIVLGIEPGGESTPIALLTRGASPPIGAGQATGLRQTVVALPGESLICFYTDGVVEARVAGSLYGAERLAHTLAQLGPEASAGELLDRVGSEADSRPDDMAACLLHVDGDAAAPHVHVEELELDRAAAASRRLGRFLLAAGLPPERIEQVVGEVDGSLAEHGGVVLELRPGAGAPEIRLRRRNFTVLRPHPGERPYDKEVSIG
jgi:serine phosphatase RsbU (regulator of sigma subunit)